MTNESNRLKDVTSPYLQQHADNPVHWWPWCEQALQQARKEDKPILLSIGYSACHWCHVMAHESFEDAATAAVMNDLYVNIKVDREERPDLDKIYQTAHQLLAQRPGGWPLTVFLAPQDLTPFFAGTYFPPQSRQGLPSFEQVLRSVHAAWDKQRDAVLQQNQSMQQALARINTISGGNVPDGTLIDRGVEELASHFDEQHGGVGGAPKFPHPSTIEFLLRHAALQQHERAHHMALFTLEHIAEGGINDQLGGGFCRYSVDEKWMIPHFEKMLYDNGPLLALYADAWLADNRRPLFRHVCERTAEWVMREMQSASGGYFSSLDADSEGEEGRFYVWDRSEAAALLHDSEYELFAARYGLDRAPNFEGRWHLHVFADTADLAREHDLAPREVRRALKSARDKLFAARAERVRPGRDEKILTSWNALMIRGMARAGRLLGQPDWIASAERALAYLRRHHWCDGRLLATSRDGKARLNAYLDDYAYLVDALLELLQARWSDQDLAFAVQLAELLLEHFEDREQGGFWFTADDHETLPVRVRPISDDAMPSGNAVAAFALQRLGSLLAEPRYLQAAERTLATAAEEMQRSPYSCTGLLCALQEWLQPPETLIIRGHGESLQEWQRNANREYRPARQVFAIPEETQLPAALADKVPAPAGPIAYRCTGTSCHPPLHDIDAL